MGLERENKKKSRRANLKAIVLDTVVIAGVLTTAALMPNMLAAMKKLGLLPHPRQRESIKTSTENLIRSGMLEEVEGGLQITKKGRVYLLKHLAWSSAKKKKEKWDGKWRVLIFDISEDKRWIRNEIRMGLISIGFLRLQDSVWVYPYPCEELIALLKADLEIGKDVLYMIVDALEHDQPIREYFGLKKEYFGLKK